MMLAPSISTTGTNVTWKRNSSKRSNYFSDKKKFYSIANRGLQTSENINLFPFLKFFLFWVYIACSKRFLFILFTTATITYKCCSH
jgi:hypothetical protein